MKKVSPPEANCAPSHDELTFLSHREEGVHGGVPKNVSMALASRKSRIIRSIRSRNDGQLFNRLRSVFSFDAVMISENRRNVSSHPKNKTRRKNEIEKSAFIICTELRIQNARYDEGEK